MSDDQKTYRVWCEECDWEDTIQGQERASRLMLLGHGVPTGHSDTRKEVVEDVQ